MKIIEDTSLLHRKLIEYKFQQIFGDVNARPFSLLSYKEGEIILHEGVELQSLLYLVEGKIKATSSVETGKSLLLRFSRPLAIIGDLELVRHVPVQSQITALTDCFCISLPFDYIYNFEMNNPLFLQDLLKHLSYKLQTSTTASRVNLLASVENRFASYLLSITAPNNEFGLELKTTNISEIADLLGTTHRHLNRVIRDLCERKIIKKDRKVIRILNEMQLKELSQGIRYE